MNYWIERLMETGHRDLAYRLRSALPSRAKGIVEVELAESRTKYEEALLGSLKSREMGRQASVLRDKIELLSSLRKAL